MGLKGFKSALVCFGTVHWNRDGSAFPAHDHAAASTTQVLDLQNIKSLFPISYLHIPPNTAFGQQTPCSMKTIQRLFLFFQRHIARLHSFFSREAQSTCVTQVGKKITSKHVTVKLMKVKEKEKKLNIGREEKKIFQRKQQSQLSCQKSVQFSHSVVSNSLQSHELQHARPPCPSPTPRVYSNWHPSSRWCHPAISSSVVRFSSSPQSLPASGSFPMSQLFQWGGQSRKWFISLSNTCINTLVNFHTSDL